MRSSIIVAIFISFQILNSHAGRPNYRLNFFDIDLLRYSAEVKKGNVMISPASIKSTLAMLLEGAEGTTATEIKSSLRVSPLKEDFRRELKSYIQALQSNTTNVVLQNANALFVAKHLQLKKDYETAARRIYFSEVVKLDFQNPKYATNRINDWVNGKTRGLIPEIVEEGSITPYTEMIVTNALYFKAPWKKGFKPKLTYSDCFYNNGVCRNVAMMNLHSELNYAFVDDLRAHALELPYLGDRYSMFLLVPQDRDSGLALIRDLPYIGLPQIIDFMESSDVYLTMPKFDIKYNEDMVETLKNMRINSLFSQTANLSGIFESGVNPYVSSIYHSVHMKVDEEGTVAAASTTGMLVPLINDIVQLKIDRPFLFFIRDNVLGLNLFEGKIEEPTEFFETSPVKGPNQVSQTFNQAPTNQANFNQATLNQQTLNQVVPNRANFDQANQNLFTSNQGHPNHPALHTNQEVLSQTTSHQHSQPSFSSFTPSVSTSAATTTTTTTEEPKSGGLVVGWFKKYF